MFKKQQQQKMVMVVVFLINKNCFFVGKYYRGAYSKLHRQSQEALAAFDRHDTTHIDWQQRLQIDYRQTLAKWLQPYVCSHDQWSRAQAKQKSKGGGLEME